MENISDVLPKITIIMPAYNSSKFIEDSIYSIIDQSYENWHLIIVDDFSNDGTTEILKKYSTNPKISLYFLLENMGAAHARQLAINKSQGDLIAFCDSDDIWHQDKLKEQVSFMSKNKYKFTYTLYSPFKIIEKKYNPVKYSKSKGYFGTLLHSMGNSTVMIDGEVCRSTEVPNIKKRNDYLYFLKIIKKVNKAYLLNKTLTYYRINDSGLSSNKIDLIKYHWKIYTKYEKLNILFSLLVILLIILRKTFSRFYTRF